MKKSLFFLCPLIAFSLLLGGCWNKTDAPTDPIIEQPPMEETKDPMIEPTDPPIEDNGQTGGDIPDLEIDTKALDDLKKKIESIKTDDLEPLEE